MSKGERATFRACFGGWALDGMDFQLYSFVIPTLIAGWHLTTAQAGTLQTTTLLASALGWGAAAILYTVTFTVLPEQTAWRVLFLAGLLPSLLVLYIRRNVEEPAVFRAARQSGDRGRFWQIFAPDIARTTALAALLATGAQGGYYAITTWLPTYLKTVRGLSVLNAGGELCVGIAGP